jgi:hypothetical protein
MRAGPHGVVQVVLPITGVPRCAGAFVLIGKCLSATIRPIFYPAALAFTIAPLAGKMRSPAVGMIGPRVGCTDLCESPRLRKEEERLVQLHREPRKNDRLYYPGDGDNAGPLMITSRSCFAFAGSLAILLAPDLASYAEERPAAIGFYQNKPATAFDVFMLSANRHIADQADLLFQDGCEKHHSLMLLRHLTHSVPSKVVDEWKASQMTNFFDFSYIEKTHTFIALFDVNIPPHHPIYTTSLGPDGEKKRGKFLEKVLVDGLSPMVQSGIMAAQDGHQVRDQTLEDMKLDAQFVKEVSGRTTVVMTWWLSSEGERDIPTPPLLTQLKNQGVRIRHYKVSAALPPLRTDARQQSVEITFQDFETTEEWSRARMQDRASSRFP